jgi:hypothetical protein
VNKATQNLVASLLSLFVFQALWSTAAMAAPEEIQVYLDEFADAGKPGLDLHTNYVPAGQQPSYHQFRVTPEFSYGVNTNWEVGAYWLTVKDAGGTPQTDGMKLRTKWRPRAPSADEPFYWAVNVEVGQLSKRFYPDGTSGEVKLIGVWKTGPWTVGMNLNFDRALKRDPMQAASTEIDTKIAYQIREGVQLGIENYSFLGANHDDPSQPQATQTNYLAADFNLGKWDINAGIGHASGPTPDRTIIKAIIGVPF